MREEFKAYYRDDIDAQKAAGKKHVRYFTTAGYEKLNALIGIIKAQGPDAACAETDFIELIAPWADYIIDKQSRKDAPLEITDILDQAINQTKTNPKINNWREFSGFFLLIILHRQSHVHYYNSTMDKKIQKAKRNGRIESAASIYARPFHLPDLDAGFMKDELGAAIANVMSAATPEEQEILRLTMYNPDISAEQILNATGGRRSTQTVYNRLDRLRSDIQRQPGGKIWFGQEKPSEDSVSEEAIAAQKKKVQALFAFPDTMHGIEIAQKMHLGGYVISFWFRNGVKHDKGVLSDTIKQKMGCYLRENGKADLVEEFEREFDAMRKLVGHKPHAKQQTMGR